jgi:hypothetical protein
VAAVVLQDTAQTDQQEVLQLDLVSLLQAVAVALVIMLHTKTQTN